MRSAGFHNGTGTNVQHGLRVKDRSVWSLVGQASASLPGSSSTRLTPLKTDESRFAKHIVLSHRQVAVSASLLEPF